MATTTKPASPAKTDVAHALAKDIRARWESESDSWDNQVAGAPKKGLPGGADLWGGMPQVDSKAIARMSDIFEKHLKIKLDAELIKPGGYESIEEAISHLIPAMQLLAKSKQGS